MARLYDITGPRGHIDMIKQSNATVALVMLTHRRQRHKVENLNQIEEEIGKITQRRQQHKADIPLWKKIEDQRFLVLKQSGN